jgi:hypothetical protein
MAPQMNFLTLRVAGRRSANTGLSRLSISGRSAHLEFFSQNLRTPFAPPSIADFCPVASLRCPIACA